MNNNPIEGLAKRFGLTLIYLFGSQAEKGRIFLEGGEVTPIPGADLDVAVAFEKASLEPMEVYGRLYRELSELFHPFNVDLLFLHEVDTLFQYEVIKGFRIYVRDDFDVDTFEENILKRSADLFHKRRLRDRDIMQAVEDGYIEFEYDPNP